MEFNDFELICRICLQEDEKMISLFDKVLNFHPKTYSEILIECASANISTDDLLPKNICIQCSTYTEQSYKLRTQCLESEKILHRAIENLRIKEEHAFHNEIDIDDNFCINEENVCKIEEVEEDLLNEEQVETTTKILNKDEIDNYQCENCSGRFSCVLELHIHTKNIHLDSTIQCPFCKKIFTNTHPLKVHCKEFIRCNVCGEKCGCRNNLIKHRKIHQTCEICGKKFSNLTKCINHKMVHSGEKPHLCPHCGKAFADYKNLQDHIRIHTGEKPFQCTLCDAKFRVSFGLKAHLTSHSNERKYSCEICNASYKRKSALNEHMKSHNNLIYQCNVCDKQLQTSDGLRGHRKIHTDEPKHVCTYCDKRFLEKYNLRTHMRTHTGEKPFACDLCGKKFTHKQSIYTHQKYCRKKLKSNVEQSKSHRNLEKKIEIE